MVVTCDIEFDNNELGIYFAGQTLTGKITLKTDKTKQVKGVALHLKGFAHTQWSETQRRHRHIHSQHHRTTYKAQADYISSVTYLIGSEESQSAVIEPGIHTYTFACHIPATCPSAFEGPHGHIRYLVKIVLIRPWKFDQTFTKGFTVLKVFDLNNDSPLLRVLAHTDMEAHFCCGMFRSKPLTLELNLPQSGYVPGQQIPVTVLVTNDSSILVKEVKLELVMHVAYHSQYPERRTKNQRLVLAKHKFDAVPRYCKKFFGFALPVPATPPTCFNQCQYIQIAYQVEVEANVRGPHANPVLTLPVTIGNVPLMGGSVQQQQNPSSGSDGLQRAITDNVSAVSGKQTSEIVLQIVPSDATNLTNHVSTVAALPPPTYEEAVHMEHGKINDDEAHDYGDGDFAPRYPVFSIPSLPSTPAADEVDGGFMNGGVTTEKDDKGTWL